MCLTNCTADTQCSSTNLYCTGNATTPGSCAAKKANGATCTAANECTDRQLRRTASAAAAPAAAPARPATAPAPGTCTPLAAGTTAPTGQCAAALAVRQHRHLQRRQRLPAGIDQHRLRPGGVVHRAPRPTSLRRRARGPARATSSRPRAAAITSAAATMCLTSCTADTQCSSTSLYCTGNASTPGSCVPKNANGAACGANNQCASGHCTDGVCCSTGSCATCQMCNLNGAGTCSNVGASTPAVDPYGRCSNTGSCGNTGALRERGLPAAADHDAVRSVGLVHERTVPAAVVLQRRRHLQPDEPDQLRRLRLQRAGHRVPHELRLQRERRRGVRERLLLQRRAERNAASRRRRPAPGTPARSATSAPAVPASTASAATPPRAAPARRARRARAPTSPTERPNRTASARANPPCGNTGTCTGGACTQGAAGTICVGAFCQNATTFQPAGDVQRGGKLFDPGHAELLAQHLRRRQRLPAAPARNDSAVRGRHLLQRGHCSSPKGLGATCGRSAECGSGHCTEGFCCSVGTCPSCQTCAFPALEGTCQNVLRGRRRSHADMPEPGPGELRYQRPLQRRRQLRDLRHQHRVHDFVRCHR